MMLDGGGDSPVRRHPWRQAAGYIAEYADSLLALVVALVFGVLGPLNVISQAVVNGSVLATLAVIAFILLRDRGAAKLLNQETREELRRLIDDGATVRILRGTEVQAAHAEARRDTDHWYFKGGTGTYLRAVTMPLCLEDRRRRMEFRIEIIDPRESEACQRYDNFRLSRSQRTAGEGDSWQPGQAWLESYATIVAACWYNQYWDFATVRVGLTRTASTFRYDMSSRHLVITRDDPELPAELIPGRTALFAAYDRELETSFGQTELVVDGRARQKVQLSRAPSPGEVQALLEELDVAPKRPLSDDEAASIVEKALNAQNPYPTKREP